MLELVQSLVRQTNVRQESRSGLRVGRQDDRRILTFHGNEAAFKKRYLITYYRTDEVTPHGVPRPVKTEVLDPKDPEAMETLDRLQDDMRAGRAKYVVQVRLRSQDDEVPRFLRIANARRAEATNHIGKVKRKLDHIVRKAVREAGDRARYEREAERLLPVKPAITPFRARAIRADSTCPVLHKRATGKWAILQWRRILILFNCFSVRLTLDINPPGLFWLLPVCSNPQLYLFSWERLESAGEFVSVCVRCH